MTTRIAEALQSYLAGRYPGAAVEDFAFVASGWESDVYSFSLALPAGKPRPLILRLFPGSGTAQKVAKEAGGLIRLREAGYPVPDVLLFETGPTALGTPFSIVEKLDGQALWPALAAAAPHETAGLLDRFTALLVDLHRLDWRPFCGDPAAYAANPLRLLTGWFAEQRQLVQTFGVPGFLPLVDWLERNIPPGGIRPAVVHRDFHANNVIVSPGGAMTVIDWTQVAVFDSRADLSWTLRIMGDLGQKSWGDHILRAYETQTGRPAAALDYFHVISDFKLLLGTVLPFKSSMQAAGLNPAKSPSIEQEAPLLTRFSRRVTAVTGITIREVEDLIG